MLLGIGLHLGVGFRVKGLGFLGFLGFRAGYGRLLLPSVPGPSNIGTGRRGYGYGRCCSKLRAGCGS